MLVRIRDYWDEIAIGDPNRARQMHSVGTQPNHRFDVSGPPLLRSPTTGLSPPASRPTVRPSRLCHCLERKPPKTEFQNLVCLIGQGKFGDPTNMPPI
jgi:hypothetical protein